MLIYFLLWITGALAMSAIVGFASKREATREDVFMCAVWPASCIATLLFLVWDLSAKRRAQT